MAIITKIELQKNNKNKVNLFLDDKFYSGVYNDVAIKYGLKDGVEIDKGKLDKILLESERNLAFNKVADYINSSLKTRKQVYEYLKKKDYSPVTINYVIDKCKEYKYIDDDYYTESYLNTYKKKYGINKLKNNLYVKGISKEIIENHLKEFEKNDDLIYNVSMKYLSRKERTPENYIKLSRFLAGRGFDFDDISHIISQLKSE